MKYPITSALLVVAGFASTAYAQDLTFIARTFDNTAVGGTAADPYDNIDNLTSATTPFRVGNAATEVAYDGANLYIAGIRNGSDTVEDPANPGTFIPVFLNIAEISDFFGARADKLVQGSTVPASDIANGEGYTGLDWDDTFGLLATLRDRNFVNDTTYIFNRTNPTDFSSVVQVSDNLLRGTTGPAYDYGYNGQLFERVDFPGEFVPAAGILEFGDGSPYGTDPNTLFPLTPDEFGDAFYNPDFPEYSIFDSAVGTLWRDFDVHPTTGLVAGRANNSLVIADRTQFGGTANIRNVVQPGGQSAFVVEQNVAIIHNPTCGGTFFVVNDRASASVDDTFENLVKIYDAQGNEMTYEVLLPDLTPAPLLDNDPLNDTGPTPGDNNLYGFHWHEPDNLLFIVGGGSGSGAGTPNVVYAFELTACPCDVDIDDSGVADFFDYTGFLDLLVAQDRAADFFEPTFASGDANDPSKYDAADVAAFDADFQNGCGN